jgi:hypothetical protein
MTVRKRLHRITLWSCAAIPVLFVMYFGLYMRIVAPLRTLHFGADGDGSAFRVVTTPRYSAPWPVPAQYNQPWLQAKLQNVFVPAHALDRRLRPDMWPDAGHIGMPNASGNFTIDLDTSSLYRVEFGFGRTGSD